MMNLVTRRGVQLARVGTYRLSTGEQTFSRQMLASAAAQQGAAPRIGIGHVDPRFDGQPALGRVEQMRLAEDGDVLVGDLVDVPGWLAAAMPSAYPGRSIEATVTGDEMRITSVRLLGATAPGIDSLADLKRMLEDEPALVAAGRDADGKSITVVLPAAGRPVTDRAREALRAAPTTSRPSATTTTTTRSTPMTDSEITRELRAAVSDGRIPDRRRAHWQAVLASRGEEGRSLLRSLTPLPREAAAAARPLSRPARPAPPPGQQAPGGDRVSADGRLTTTAHGTVLYQGRVPTRISDHGERLVFSEEGWCPIADFEARGLTPADSAMAIAGANGVCRNTPLGRAYHGERP